MSKMGLHDPFGHLKHKLWPKERLQVKLTIWLPTIKSWELTRFIYVQVVCDISLKSSQWGLQFCSRPHLNLKSAREIMSPQSCEIPNFGNFGGVSGQNAIWMWTLWRGIEYTIMGKVVASPKSKTWWVLWVQVWPWLVLAPKML